MHRLNWVRLLLSGLAICLVLLSLPSAGASSANVSHSYQSSGSTPVGSIVSLDPQKTNYVDLANTDNGSSILGVAVASSDSLLAIDPTQGEVQVATTGTANTLVSNLSGDINVGDKVAVSPFNGLGMKASIGDEVIGLAQTVFNSNTSGATNEQITDKNGNISTIQVGYVRLSIAIGLDTTGNANSSFLSGLQKLGQSITGHTVSTARIVLSLVVAFVTLVSLVVLIYASIYGSIISIGRNPLAKYSIFRTLTSITGMAVLTAGIAGITIFFLLH